MPVKFSISRKTRLTFKTPNLSAKILTKTFHITIRFRDQSSENELHYHIS